MKRVLFYAVLAASVCRLASAQPAPRGTAEGTIQGKKVTIDYGRLELKGRTLDSLIEKLPADRVWRTGVNEVTTLTTEAPLTVGGKKVPAGKYSVYIYAPATGDWSLLLNSDPGIELGELGKLLGFNPPPAAAKKLWPHLEGYDPNPEKKIPGIAKTEVARAAMKSGTADPAVDTFTVSLKPSSGGLSLVFALANKTWTADLKPAS
jgi:hypothetical protein